MNIVDYVKGLTFKDEETKEKFIRLAEIYQEGGEDFYQCTPRELQDFTMEDEGLWVEFLSNKAIKAWLDQRLAVIMDTLKRRSTLKLAQDIKEGGEISSRDIKNISEIINANSEKDNNIRIFVTRIPEKEYEDEDEEVGD